MQKYEKMKNLLFSCYQNMEEIRRFDVLADRPVQSFIGSGSLEYNLQFLPKDRRILEGTLQEADRNKLPGDLDENKIGRGMLPAVLRLISAFQTIDSHFRAEGMIRKKSHIHSPRRGLPVYFPAAFPGIKMPETVKISHPKQGFRIKNFSLF